MSIWRRAQARLGDELGAAVIAGRIARSIMLLCFLYEKRYAPYPKWLGTAFADLECAAELAPILRAALTGATWRERQQNLCAAYETLNRLHNASGLTAPVQPGVQAFHKRGFFVSNAWRYIEPLLQLLEDPEVRAIGESGHWSEASICSAIALIFGRRHQELRKPAHRPIHSN